MSDSTVPCYKRVVVFIGRTGSGKSTCANALTGDFDSFKESDGSVSETKFVEAKTVRVDRAEGKVYDVKIVDTIGIGDTKLSPDEVLQRLAAACHECREGINAVLFVTGGRFTKEEADAWDVMWQVLFGSEVFEHTAIIRTNFRKFQDPNEVADDKKKLREEGGPAAGRILPNVKHFLYVDNPPEEYGGKEIREKSRDILLTHLIVNCEKVFQPPIMREVKERISQHANAHQEAIKKQEQMEVELKRVHDEIERLQIQVEVNKANREKEEAEKAMAREMEAIIEQKANQEAMKRQEQPDVELKKSDSEIEQLQIQVEVDRDNRGSEETYKAMARETEASTEQKANQEAMKKQEQLEVELETHKKIEQLQIQVEANREKEETDKAMARETEAITERRANEEVMKRQEQLEAEVKKTHDEMKRLQTQVKAIEEKDDASKAEANEGLLGRAAAQLVDKGTKFVVNAAKQLCSVM
ncbi:uncharacterized protein LOC134183205 [Corticium candelabrum]|uniref:uncharacterized protein LOC134183205 n=1 Tax=Corticium candelabrum TaxID=121492 RepID=UPI002E276AB9|nr:uncharacterized protein LOC134183205 [Corticium candelabrum]